MRYQLAGYSPLSLGGLLRAGFRDAGSEGALGRLADELTDSYAADHVTLYASGTDALRSALEGWGGNGTVALPAYSCFDLASAAVGARASVVFYDIDPSTLGPDLGSLRAALQSGAGAVVVGNLYGFPLNWDEVRNLCAEFGAWIVEDAAQGIGSSWRGIPSGTFGDVTVLSFGRGKGWTGGGGGALLSRGRAAARAHASTTPGGAAPSAMKLFLVTLGQWLLGRPQLYGLPASIPALGLGQTQYKPPVDPRPMSPFSAALILESAAQAQAEIEVRRSTALRWRGRIESLGFAHLIEMIELSSEAVGSYLRMPIRVPSAALATRVAAETRRFGVTRGYPAPLPRLPSIAPLLHQGYAIPHIPGATELSERLINLPTHSWVTSREVDRAASRLDAALTCL